MHEVQTSFATKLQTLITKLELPWLLQKNSRLPALDAHDMTIFIALPTQVQSTFLSKVEIQSSLVSMRSVMVEAAVTCIVHIPP